MANPNCVTTALHCPICHDRSMQIHVIPKFASTGHGHVWCRACGGTYDDNTKTVQDVFATGAVDATRIESEIEYRKLFVETSNITGKDGTVYPKFAWDNNAEMQALLSADMAECINRHVKSTALRILDLGCGNGFTTRGMARVFGIGAMVGMDPSPTIQSLKSDPPIEHYQGTLDSIKFPDASFDVVTIIGNLMLHPDPSRTLQEVARILKKDGVVVFDFKNIRCMSRLLSIFLASRSPRLAQSRLLQRNFVNMRFGLHRDHLTWLCPPENFQLLEVSTKPPRLLVFSNKSNYVAGLKGMVWSLLNYIDKIRDEQSWLQVAFRRI